MSPKIEKAGKMKKKNLNEVENVFHIEPTNLNNQKEDEAECSPPSVSLKLTEMVAMGGHDDDSETQSRLEDNDTVYQVKPEYTGILRKIIDKYGDIAKECKVKTVKCRSQMLENICEVISMLDNEDFRNLKGVEKLIDITKDVKSMNVKVDWLLMRLTEILEAREAFKEGSKLKQKTDNINSACQNTEIVENSTIGEPDVIEENDECSSPSLSLKLSDMVAMVGNDDNDDDDDDEDDDYETQSRSEDNVNAYQVKPEYKEILRKIIDKHGDIAKNCQAKSVKYRSMMLEIICEVVSELDNKDFTNLKGVKRMIGQIDDVKEMKVEVEWLHTRLTEILEARQIFKQGVKLKQRTDSITGLIEIAESELKDCEVEKKKLSQKLKEICESEADWKGRLARMQEVSVKTSQEVKDATSKVKRFLKCSLIDDLLNPALEQHGPSEENVTVEEGSIEEGGPMLGKRESKKPMWMQDFESGSKRNLKKNH